MKRILPVLSIVAMLILLKYEVTAQNVGIGVASPTNRLHVAANSSVPMKIENLAGTTAEIQFNVPGLTKGYVGAYINTFEIMTVGATPLFLGTNLTNRLVVGATGNIGIGSFDDPNERLVVESGNIQLLNSVKGIMLQAGDLPIITRGFDQFTSGSKTGLGRWGLFMEPSRLTLGIPNIEGKAVEIAAYATNSTRTTLMTVNNEGELNRPATGGADLVPVCMGSVRWNNGTLVNTPIINGTGNFTLTPYAEAGMVEITITGHYYSTANYVTQVTCIRDTNYGTQSGFGAAQDSGNGKLRVYTFINGSTQYSRSFHFIVYKIN